MSRKQFLKGLVSCSTASCGAIIAVYLIYLFLTDLGLFLPKQVQTPEFFTPAIFLWGNLGTGYATLRYINWASKTSSQNLCPVSVDRIALMGQIVWGIFVGFFGLIRAGFWPT